MKFLKKIKSASEIVETEYTVVYFNETDGKVSVKSNGEEPQVKRLAYYTVTEDNIEDCIFSNGDGNSYLIFGCGEVYYEDGDVFKSFTSTDPRIQKYEYEWEYETLDDYYKEIYYGIKLGNLNEMSEEEIAALMESLLGDYVCEFELIGTEIDGFNYSPLTKLSNNALDGVTSIGDSAISFVCNHTKTTDKN